MSELPDNWVSPVNYYDGKIYVRYQILEQPKVDMDGDGTKEYTRKTKFSLHFGKLNQMVKKLPEITLI